MRQHRAKQIAGASLGLGDYSGSAFYAGICPCSLNRTFRLSKPLFSVPLLKQDISRLALS